MWGLERQYISLEWPARDYFIKAKADLGGGPNSAKTGNKLRNEWLLCLERRCSNDCNLFSHFLEITVTLPGIWIQSAWSLSCFPPIFISCIHSLYLLFRKAQIYTSHHTGCIENTHTKMSQNKDLSLSLYAPMLTIISCSSLQPLVSAPERPHLKLRTVPGRHLLYRSNVWS